MIIRREALQAVLPATRKTDATHRCDKVQITPAGDVVATNGHTLLIARESTRFPDEDFPSKDLPAYHGDATESITLERALVDRLLTGIPKRTPIPILSAVQIGVNGDGGTYAAATDLDSPTVIRIKPQSEQAGGFPTWERVLPKADRPGIRITLSADNLIALAKAAGLVDKRNEHGGRITLFIPTEPQHQGLDKAKAIADGAIEERTQYGTDLKDKHGRLACARDYPNGQIVSAIRVEIDGPDVQVCGAVAPMYREGK